MKRIAVIGAGAAGCFAAIRAKRLDPQAEVTVYEAGRTALAKVAVTGGGRCNLTNSFERVERLRDVYPRGEQLMKRALRAFGNQDCMSWWEHEGVRLTTQEDCCVFPVSQDAMQIVRTLENLMRRLGVNLVLEKRLSLLEDGYTLTFADGSRVQADAVIFTIGGSSTEALRRILPADIELVSSVPSLFTFKIQDESLRSLMGAVVEDASLSLAGTSFRTRGALLITDWGVSGPATLKLSSHAAVYLAQNAYKGTLLVNWLSASEAEARVWIADTAAANARKQLASIHPEGLTERLWRHILAKAGVREDLRWAELGAKGINRLVSTLIADQYEICGRARFKEEFVTCGGVSLKAIDQNTLECRSHKGLFFAGEVLDVDAVTGGFNLQAAWSMGYVAAQSACDRER